MTVRGSAARRNYYNETDCLLLLLLLPLRATTIYTYYGAIRKRSPRRDSYSFREISVTVINTIGHVRFSKRRQNVTT